MTAAATVAAAPAAAGAAAASRHTTSEDVISSTMAIATATTWSGRSRELTFDALGEASGTRRTKQPDGCRAVEVVSLGWPFRDALEDTLIAAPPPAECPSAAEFTPVDRKKAATCADRPCGGFRGYSGLRLDTSCGRTPIPSSMAPRGGTTVAVATATVAATTAATATATTTGGGGGGTSAFPPPASPSKQRTTQTSDRRMGAAEGTTAAEKSQERGEALSPLPQRFRPLRLSTPPPPPVNPGSRPDPSPPSTPRPNCESDEDTSSCMKSAEEELAAACASPPASRRRRRGCRSPSSPRGRPSSPACQRRGSRSPSPRSPSPRPARSGSISPSRRTRAAVSSPVAMIKCSFPKANIEDDFDEATEAATPPLTPLQDTPPRSMAPLGVSPSSRRPFPGAEDDGFSTHAGRGGPNGFFADDDEPTNSTTTTTTAEGSADVASTPLRPLHDEKQQSCREKMIFSGLLSRNACGGSGGSGGGSGGPVTSLNKQQLIKGKASWAVSPAALVQNSDEASASAAAAAAAITSATATAAATAAATAVNANTAGVTASATTTTTAAAAATTDAATAPATGGRRARRVSWSPMVLARAEAAATIRPFVERYWECEELKRRVAHDQAEARLFIKRRAEQKQERERGWPVASRPVARRGGFFELLLGLESSELRGYRMWSDLEPFSVFVPLELTAKLVPKICGGGGSRGSGGASIDGKHGSISAYSPPVRWTMGDFVRKMSTDQLNRV